MTISACIPFCLALCLGLYPLGAVAEEGVAGKQIAQSSYTLEHTFKEDFDSKVQGWIALHKRLKEPLTRQDLNIRKHGAAITVYQTLIDIMVCTETSNSAASFMSCSEKLRSISSEMFDFMLS